MNRLRMRKEIADLTSVLILGLFLNLCINLILYPSPVSAQQFSGSDPSSIPPQIEKEWQERLEYLKKGEREKANAATEMIKKIGAELGADNIDIISIALLIEADEYISKGNLEAAMEDINFAKEISPDYPASYYFSSRVLFLKNKSLPRALSSYTDALLVTYKDFWNIFYRTGTFLIILFLSLISSFVIFLFYMLVRYIPLLEHNLCEWTGVSFKRYTIIMIVIIISSVPLLLQKGILWIPIFWLMLVWIYLRKKEAIIGLTFLFLIGLATLLYPLVGSFFLLGESREMVLMNRIVRGEWVSPQGRYEPIFDENGEEWKGYFSAAISMKMQGRFDEALNYYEKALSKNPGSAKVLNNIGNIYFFKKDFGRAIGYYKDAIEKDSSIVSSHYNMSQALREMLSFEEGNKKYEEARGLNKKLTDLYAKKSTLSYQHLVVDERFSMLDLFNKALSFNKDKANLLISQISVFLNGIPTPFFQVFLLILAFIMIFSPSYLARNAQLSISCPVCGKAICRRCHRYIFDIKVCNTCLALLKKRQGDKKKIRGVGDIKEVMIRSKKKEEKATFLALLIPGLGHLLMDRPFKGYTINIFFFILIWSWFINNALIKTTLPSSSNAGSYWYLSYILLMIFIFGYSAFDIYRSREYI